MDERIVCWRPVATRPVDGMSWLIWVQTPPLRDVDGELVPVTVTVTVDGATYEPILLEPLEVFDAWLNMLQWVTEGDVRAEVRHALEIGTMTEKEWAISHGNSQIRGAVTLEGDALAAEQSYLRALDRAPRHGAESDEEEDLVKTTRSAA